MQKDVIIYIKEGSCNIILDSQSLRLLNLKSVKFIAYSSDIDDGILVDPILIFIDSTKYD